MSAATTQQTVTVPDIKKRSWATVSLVLIDVLALELSLFLGCLVRFFLHSLFPIALNAPQYQGLALGILTLPLAYGWVGLYPGYGMSAVQRIRSRVYATATIFVVLLMWNYTLYDGQWSRGVLILTMFFALVLAPALEAPLRRVLIKRGICGVPVIVLGAGRTGALVAKTLQKERDLGFILVGMLDDDPEKWGTSVHGVRVVGPLSAAEAFAGRAKVALIAIPRMQRERLSALVEHLSFPNVIVVPDLFGIQSLWITSRDLGGVLGLEVKKNLLITSNRVLKRSLDYAISVPAFLLSLPLLAIFAAWVKMVSPGSPFFIQQREGKNGHRIKIYKLRTMHPDAERLLSEHLNANPIEKEDWLRYYKLKRDPRILPGIGWFLRRYSLDELPQLWNVIRGEISLVGPRPFPSYHLAGFPESFRGLRASVMPGITGLWQVSARSDGDLEVQQAEDTYYIRNWSVWLDIYILLRTLLTVLSPNGAY
ncbi:MAG: exopolysaccharide biosynthesis polyprenyl glycosylphosphotransferase [Acidobacteriaceae bacterium]|nr:exopolysaccharide biosynthesis polyprenyl glycosylphosphotransferase [Acidobacteriaceae bacterium]